MGRNELERAFTRIEYLLKPLRGLFGTFFPHPRNATMGSVERCVTFKVRMEPLKGMYRASYPTVTDGKEVEAQFTADGKLVTSSSGGGGSSEAAVAPTLTDRSTALESNSLSSAVPVVFLSLTGALDASTAAGTYYVQVGDAASVPTDGAVTTVVAPYKIVHTAGFDDDFTLDFSSTPKTTSAGLWWDVSTTQFTKTLATGALASATMSYRAIAS